MLDRAVDAAYVAAEKAAGRKVPKLATDAERVAFLFERYQALTSLLLPRKRRAGAGRRRQVDETCMRHARTSAPGPKSTTNWIPAFAGMTSERNWSEASR